MPLYVNGWGKRKDESDAKLVIATRSVSRPRITEESVTFTTKLFDFSETPDGNKE